MCIEVDESNLKRLEDITRRLFGSPRNGSVLTHVVEYDVGPEGIAFGEAIYVDETFAIQKATLAGATEFPLHRHKFSAEWLICISGSFTVRFEDGHEVVVGKREGVYIPAGALHFVMISAHTRMLGISIPPAGGYPGVDASPSS